MIPFELAAIFVQLQAPESRLEGAARLAAHSGANAVLLFGKDREIGVFLPAPGLPQTLRDGGRWQAFLDQCAQAGSLSAAVPDPRSGADTVAFAMADSHAQAAIVFLGC